MNIEQVKNQKTNPQVIEDMDFDFKPITSGLGFHHQKATEVKPVITERTVAMSTLTPPIAPMKKEMNVYQNDLSLFYNQTPPQTVNLPEMMMEQPAEEKYYRLAGRPQRVMAYFSDLLFIVGSLGIILTVMARTISMDLVDVWTQYPNEVTPLVVTLFCGFYLIYFSIFEKTGPTLGKSMFKLRVVDLDNNSLSLMSLIVRSTVSLLNFISLGLFSYFDLQNKVTGSKVIRID